MLKDDIQSFQFWRSGILAYLGLMLGGLIVQAASPIRIEPLGDSITYGQGASGGYRLSLYQLLTNAGFNVDFVGTQTGNGASGLPDSNHEGYPGYRIDQIDAGFLGWANSVSDPDIILLLIGTNDYGQNYDTPNAINRLDRLIGNIVTNRPNAKLVVANVLLRTDSPSLDSSIQTTFNAYIAGRVANRAALGQQVYFLNLRAAVGTGDLYDGLHPNQSGYNKMAVSWFGAITNLITPLGTTNPPVISRVAGGANWTNVIVTFSKPVTSAATNLSNFSLNGGLTISSATLDPVGQRAVTLTTSAQLPGHSYTLTVNNVQDITPSHLTIIPGTTATFIASTTLLTYEGFNYNPGISLDAQAGGVGWDAQWGQFLGGAVNHTIVSGSLANSTGTLLTSGNHVSTTVAGAYAGRFPLLPGYGTGTFYCSVLMRYDLTDGNPGDDYFGMQLYANPANASSDLFVGKAGASAFLRLETSGNIGSGGTIPAQSSNSTTTAAVGQTYFLVVRVDFAAGAAANADTFKLYVNPTPGGTEPVLANATLSYNLGVQNGLAIQSGNGAQVSVDEIRIGKTYADVTPSNGVVSALPTLSISLSGSNAIISWPTSNGAGFNLYSRTTAASGTWIAVTPSPTVVGANYQVKLPHTGNVQFFRLSQSAMSVVL